jgi:hypothetical protein
MTRITQPQLESYLWGAATLLRGTGDYKSETDSIPIESRPCVPIRGPTFLQAQAQPCWSCECFPTETQDSRIVVALGSEAKSLCDLETVGFQSDPERRHSAGLILREAMSDASGPDFEANDLSFG